MDVVGPFNGNDWGLRWPRLAASAVVPRRGGGGVGTSLTGREESGLRDRARWGVVLHHALGLTDFQLW